MDCVNQAGEHANPGRKKMEISTPAGVANHERNWQVDERWSSYAARFAPVEARVGYENGDTADHEGNESGCSDPVGDADNRRMAWTFDAIGTEAVGTPVGEPGAGRVFGH